MRAPDRQIRLRLSGAMMSALAAASLRTGLGTEELIRRAVRADLLRAAHRKRRAR